MNRRAFTLIELLAVIVILAIIALIAVPIVVNIINDSKKESLQRSIDLYIDTAEKAITKYQMTHPDFNPRECTIEDKKLTCDEVPIEVEMKGQVPESGTIKIVDNKISYENLLLEGIYYHMDTTGEKTISQEQKTLETEDYRGYYADVDGDGAVDGVIYADLAYSSEEGAQWYNSNGTYSYTAKTNLNEYTVSNNTYKENDGFGENKIIKLKKDKGNARFYVMALEDFIIEAYTDPNDSNNSHSEYSSFFWYKNARNKMNTYETDTSEDFGTGYTNTGKIIEIWNRNGTGAGSYSGATKDNEDIWNHIQEKYNSKEKWYIPSRGEWAAFADYFTNQSNLETKLTTNNYKSLYGLTYWYWSSSQYSKLDAWYIDFYRWFVSDYWIDTRLYIRLGVTF